MGHRLRVLFVHGLFCLFTRFVRFRVPVREFFACEFVCLVVLFTSCAWGEPGRRPNNSPNGTAGLDVLALRTVFWVRLFSLLRLNSVRTPDPSLGAALHRLTGGGVRDLRASGLGIIEHN